MENGLQVEPLQVEPLSPLSPSGRPRARTNSVVVDSAGHVTEVPALPLSSIHRTTAVAQGPFTLSSRHRSSGIVVGTPLGFDISLAVPRAQLRELQCAVCGALIQSPVHAPCGHSFCHAHLGTDGEEADKLDRTAANLKYLCVDLAFPIDRAFEALAASPENLERAEELCREASGIEGHAVRVRSEVLEPQFSWGSVTRQSIGVLDRADNHDNHATVHFPTQSRWNCLLSEIEVEPIADRVRCLGTVVRVRRGVHPARGWGALHGDKVGKVMHWSHSQVVVQCATSIWRGYVGELEPVETSSSSSAEVLLAALDRLGSSPSDACRATLGAILRHAASGLPGAKGCTLRGARRKAIMYSHGAMDLLRTAGYEMLKWDNRTTESSRVLLESSAPEFVKLAIDAITALEEKYGPCPEPSPEEDERFVVMLTVDSTIVDAVSFDTLWQDTMKPVLIPALSPPGTSWSWTQRGWQSEMELRQHVEKHIGSGPTEVAKWQMRKEAELITERLVSMGLSAAMESIGVISGEEPASEDADEIYEVEAWQGPILEGSRVHFCPAHGKFPQHVTAASVGVVGSQYRSSQTGVQLIVNFPGSVTATVNITDVKVDEEAELITPGVRVKVRAGSEPQFGWQGVQASDVGNVIKVTFDAIALVYVPGIPGLFRATLKDLDTQDLPMVARGDCPVCHKPFQGEHLAIDIAVEAQLKRIRRLMAGERTANNGALGGEHGGVQARKCLRSNTHRDELMCSICFELLNVPVTLSCGHSFCKAHIEAWLLHNHYCPLCKQRVLPQRLRRQHLQAPRSSFFDIELRDDQDEEPGGIGPAVQDWPEMSVNEMLQSQIHRYFPDEAETRTTEIAAEVWECIQKRARGYLERLRAFLRQSGTHAITQFISLGLQDMDMRLPGTNRGTLLMLAAEQGLSDVVLALIERRCDPLLTTSALHDAGSTALSVAAAQGRTEVIEPLLEAAEWPAARYADALAAAIEQGQTECIHKLLSLRERAAELINSFGFPAILMAVQANRQDVVNHLLNSLASLDAPLTSGLLVHGAGAVAINGAYQIVGDFEGRPYYQNANGAIIYCKGWWKMTNSKAGLGKGWYYSMPEPHAETPEPPLGSWTTAGYDNTIQNVLPPPNVERLGCEGNGVPLSPLLLSVHQGLTDVTKLLLSARADPCMQSSHTGESVLQVASSGGDLNMVRILLCAKASTCSVDHQGRTPLSTACVGGHHLVVADLLQAAAPPDSEEMPFPLLLASSCGTFPPRPGGRALAPARADKFAKVVMLLLAKKADPHRRSSDGALALHAAAVAGANPVALEALIEAGVDPGAVDDSGNTPLIAAILAGRIACAATLCKKGRCALTPQSDGLTPLMVAALVGDADILGAVLESTAVPLDQLCSPHEGLSSPVAVVRSCNGESQGVAVDDWKLVRESLAEPLDISVRCWRGHACERMNCLCGRTPVCDVCTRNIERSEALFLTCRRCNYDVCIVCSGLPPLARLPPDFSTDLRDWTPLHFAAAAGHAEVAHRLLEAVPDLVRAVDAEGRTALHVGAVGGHAWLLEVLLDAGADASALDSLGVVAISRLPHELLRYAADSEYLQGSSLEVGRIAAGAPGESSVAGIYRSHGDRDGRPCYSRSESPGWAICWDSHSCRWGLYQERYDAAYIQYQNKADMQRCPILGWEPALASGPAPAFEEILPWRAGCSLLRATQEDLRPEGLSEALRALSPDEPLALERIVQIPAGSFPQVESLPSSTSATVQLPPGAPPIEHLMQEMIRRGQLPIQDEPACAQQ